jgi:hypothetical protein
MLILPDLLVKKVMISYTVSNDLFKVDKLISFRVNLEVTSMTILFLELLHLNAFNVKMDNTLRDNCKLICQLVG